MMFRRPGLSLGLTMEFFVLSTLVLATLGAPPKGFYHERVGIPMAERIKQQESAVDFDGFRIVGGSPTVAGVHPFLMGQVITMMTGHTSSCTGSMLSNTRGLTAAHCWWDGAWQAIHYELVFGSTFLFSGGVRIITDQVVMHPEWNPDNLYADIAVVNFNWVSYTNVIQPIAIPTGSDAYANKWALAVGYGQTSQTTPITINQTQHHVWLWVISNDECRRHFGIYSNPSTVCTSGAGAVGICPGDSGGPLYVIEASNRIQIGVSSFHSWFGCDSGNPAGFTRVTFFTSWIRQRL